MLLFLLAGALSAQSFRLSRHLERVETGQVREFSVHGDRALFHNGAVFIVRTEGDRKPVRISSPRPSTSSSSQTSTYSPRVSPDAAHVVYLRSDGVRGEVVQTPFDREEPLILAELTGSFDYEPVGFTPDSSWFLYRYHDDLWSVRVDASQSPILLHSRQSWRGIQFSADSLHVVVETRSPISPWGLFSLRIDGSRPQIDLANLFTNILEFGGITADGVHAIFRAGTFGFMNLLRVRVDGSAAPERIAGPDVLRFGAFAGDRMIYTVAGSTSGLADFYSVPQDGSSAPSLIATDMVPLGVFTDKFTADGRSLVLGEPTGVGDSSALYRVAVDGGSLPQALGAIADRADFFLDPAGRSVLFEPASGAPGDLASVPLDGSRAPVTIASGGAFRSPAFASDANGLRLVFWSGTSSGYQAHVVPVDGSGAPVALDLFKVGEPGTNLVVVGENVLALAQDERDALALFSAPLAGAAPRELSQDALTTGIGDVAAAKLSPSGVWAVYRGDVRTSGVSELFSTNKIEHHCLSRGLGGVSDFSITEDSKWVVFLAGGALFSAPIAGGQPPRQLSSPGEQVWYRLVPGGDVLFSTSVPVPASYVVPADGSAPARLLPFFARVFEPSPDGLWVVYRETLGRDLWSAPLDGHAPPVKLADQLDREFRITPDSSRVVWKHTLPALRSAPIDGSAPAATLSDTTLSQSLGLFELTADSQSVVFLQGTQLFSNSVNGANLQPLASGVGAFEVLGSRARVVFQASGIHHVVPITGGAPIALHGDEILANPGMAVSRDEREVLFAGRARDFSATGLYRVSPDTPGTPVLLVPDLLSLALTFLPDEERFAYVLEGNLHVARLDGLGNTRRLNPTLASGEGVVDFSVGPLGKHLIYRATQHSPFTFELYASFLEPLEPKRQGPGAPTGLATVELP